MGDFSFISNALHLVTHWPCPPDDSPYWSRSIKSPSFGSFILSLRKNSSFISSYIMSIFLLPHCTTGLLSCGCLFYLLASWESGCCLLHLCTSVPAEQDLRTCFTTEEMDERNTSCSLQAWSPRLVLMKTYMQRDSRNRIEDKGSWMKVEHLYALCSLSSELICIYYIHGKYVKRQRIKLRGLSMEKRILSFFCKGSWRRYLECS